MIQKKRYQQSPWQYSNNTWSRFCTALHVGLSTAWPNRSLNMLFV